MSFGHKELELPLTTKCGVLETKERECFKKEGEINYVESHREIR